MLPRSEIQFAFRDSDDHFAPHDLAFEMRVSVVLSCAVVVILFSGRVRREFLEPDFVIVMESAFVVVDENRRRYVRCPFAICKSRACVAPILTDGRAPRELPQSLKRSESTLNGAGWSFT